MEHWVPTEGIVVERLSTALTFPTVAGYPAPADQNAFTEFLDFVAQSFPTLFSTASVKREDPWRLVIELAGSDSSLPPVLILAHFDVVGIEENTESDWEHPPFSGTVADDFIWGRGSIDDKSSLMAILEAAEEAARSGRVPTRGLVLAFGGDEELSGRRGAATTAAEFKAAGRRFRFVLDEGSVIAEGMLNDVPMPLALIGLAEKGHVNIKVSARTAGGHAAMPSDNTAVGVVSQAIVRIEAHPFPIRRLDTIESFLQTIGGVATGAAGFAYRHPRILWRLIAKVLSSRPSSNALIRTSQAVTMTEGSAVPNVLPQQATCVVNVRILPGESVESVLSRYQRLLSRLPVTVDLLDPEDAHDPVPETSPSHAGFAAISASLANVLPDVLVAPFIVTGSTDSKYYANLSDAVLRFVPMTLTSSDLDRVHGTNERLSVPTYLGMIRFYSNLFERVCW